MGRGGSVGICFGDTGVDICFGGGKGFCGILDGVIQITVPLWDDLIEGKFMDTAPHVAKIHTIVNKIWPLGNQAIRIEVFGVDKTTVKFRIKDANT